MLKGNNARANMRFTDIDPDQAIIKQFIPFCARQLGMTDLPEIEIFDNPEMVREIEMYVSENWCACDSRYTCRDHLQM